MANFGDELLVVNAVGEIPEDPSRSVGERLLSVSQTSRPSLLYFHPRVYNITASNPLPEVTVPGGRSVRVLEFPERHTLWFARGAVLRLEPGVVIILRGAIKADPFPIFDLSSVRDTRAPDSSLVRIESTRVEEIYPEWFGVNTVDGSSYISPGGATRNTAAYQACLHAAVRDRVRDGVSLPPLTVVSRGIFTLSQTLDVLPDVNGRGALWMSGDGDATRRGADIPSLNRYPRAADPGASEPNSTEDGRSAILRLHPRVSAEISGVGFRCLEFAGGQRTTRDVAHALLIEEALSPEPASLPRARHVRLERCGLTGGREAVIGLTQRAPESLPPGSSDARAPRPLAAVSRPVSRYSLESCVLDAVLSGAVGAVGVTATHPPRSARHAIHLDSKGGSIFEITESLVFQTKGVYFDTAGRPFSEMDLEAGVWVKGISTLVRAVSFHLGEGPRPSRPAPPNNQPETADGQDLWLVSADEVPAPHLTVLHADSQSWWHLGADPIRSRRPGAVCLLNVGAGDVNLSELEEASVGLLSLTRMRFMRHATDQLEERRIFTPPSVWWPTSKLPLVLVACIFKRYAVRQNQMTPVMNVGSTFFKARDASRSVWLSPAAVPRPLPGDLYAGIRDGRLIPESEAVSSVLNAQGLPVLLSE